MDFKTAEKTRSEMGEVFVVERIQFKLYVTPEAEDDFKKYCADFDEGSFTDKSALKYCTNDRYEIRAIRLDEGKLNWEYPDLQPL